MNKNLLKYCVFIMAAFVVACTAQPEMVGAKGGAAAVGEHTNAAAYGGGR
ncbi:hypothetical protein [Telmatospirillum siberiense]|nr:hypothetical protein [Telmatospirillum siberiense]